MRKHKGDGYTSGKPGTMTQKTEDKWTNRNHQKQWFLLFCTRTQFFFNIYNMDHHINKKEIHQKIFNENYILYLH